MSDNDSASSEKTPIILSIRLIRSFEHRNIRHVPFRLQKSTDQITVGQLKQEILQTLPNEKLPPPFKTFAFDTLKIEHYPHHAKTNDVVLGREQDEQLILDDDKYLSDYKIVDGTEIAFFKRSDYEVYKQNPTLVLD